MKKILKTTIFAFLLISLGSCTNEKSPVAIAKGLNLHAISPSSPFVLSASTGDITLATLTWDATDNGVASSACTYEVEIAKTGTNFATYIVANTPSTSLSNVWTVGYINSLLLANGFLPDVASSIDVRIKSTLGLDYNPFVQYSNVLTISVTPFSQAAFSFTMDTKDPASGAKTLSSGIFTTDTEGYAYLAVGSYKFYTSVQNVFQASNPYYGSGGTGTLALSGASIPIATAGYYRIMADIGAKTFSVTPVTWGIIGTAKVFGSANSLPAMTYDPSLNKWNITISLKGGKTFNFRANNSNVINLGAGSALAGTTDFAGATMRYNGAGTTVPGLSTVTASYLVTLDLSSPRNYSYTFVKQ